jgi:hypothetical protein
MFQDKKNILKNYCNCKYYNQYDSSILLKDVQKNIDSSIMHLNKEFVCIFYKMINTEPCSYWSGDVYKETYSQLESLYQTHSNKLSIDENVFNYFIMGYNAYCQISETILDLSNFNLTLELKTRLYRLPTYTSILESCLSNFLRVIATLTGQGIGKDYSSQNTLGQLVNVINSNGYSQICGNIDVNIRNAINHGKVLFKKDPGDKLCFYYSEQGVSKSKELSIFEFDKMIEKAFDTASAVLLALTVFLNSHMQLINIDETKNEYVPFAFLAMRISIPGVYCQSISDTGNLNQLNIELDVENTERGHLAQIAMLLSVLIFDAHADYNKYLFSFSHPRMMNSWIIFQKQDILDLLSDSKTMDVIISEIIERKEFLIFPPSTEDIDINEAKYFCFPNFTFSNFKINNIANASTEDRKRLRANLFIGDTDERNEIITIINQAIELLLTVKNPASPTFEQKHGDMPADSLYINVYRNDGRKCKELLPSNDNFICFVDYNASGITTLKNGGLPANIWNSYLHEKIDNKFIAWGNHKYATIRTQKIGRNDPCPCGSGKKYKKCCGLHK